MRTTLIAACALVLGASSFSAVSAESGLGNIEGARLASDQYPPCRPGRGDDRCIQLYEADVVAHGPVSSGLGGPYEPVDGADVDAALGMNLDPAVDSRLATSADASGAFIYADHNEFSGVGGPIEAQAGYPPCARGRGDDRCIQLYERGVTGVGN